MTRNFARDPPGAAEVKPVLISDSLSQAFVQQRRHITILFSDLSDSTRISEIMEPELYADLLQQLRDVYEQVIPRNGGEIIRIDGDGVLCIFGYPVPHEDPGRRAVEAAIDLHRAVASLDLSRAVLRYPIQLHSGIHAGVVLVRGGDIIRGKFEILGDATNIAAHLCESAGAGQILVSEATLGGDISYSERARASGEMSAAATSAWPFSRSTTVNLTRHALPLETHRG